MDLPVLLAHGILGPWDDLIFLGVAVVFLVIMGISWIYSRTFVAELEEEDQSETTSQENAESSDQFKLD